MSLRRAIVDVRVHEIVQYLQLPPGTQVHAANYSFERDTFELMIVHPDLEIQPEGAFAPVIQPTMDPTGGEPLSAEESMLFVRRRWPFGS